MARAVASLPRCESQGGRSMITVRQLIEKLQALPDEQKDLPAVLEGCDCYGKASGEVDLLIEHRENPAYVAKSCRRPGEPFEDDLLWVPASSEPRFLEIVSGLLLKRD